MTPAALAQVMLSDDAEGSHPVRALIHRNTFRHSLGVALQQSFPVVRRLVGEPFFSAMSSAYVTAHPPRSQIMSQYGDALPAFIETFEPARTVPYLADVARLERARIRAFHAGEAASPGPDLGTDMSAALDQSYALHPSATWISSAYPILRIWDAHQASDIEPVENWTAQDVLVFRSADGVRQAELSRSEREFLSDLLVAPSLSAALDRYSTSADAFAAVRILTRLHHAHAVVAMPTLPNPRTLHASTRQTRRSAVQV